MDKILYKLLLPLVNDKSCYTILKEYAEARIALLQNNLSFEQDIDKIRSYQGAIAELRRIKTLREETIKGAEG